MGLGFRGRVLVAALPALLIPPLWIGVEMSRREDARVRAVEHQRHLREADYARMRVLSALEDADRDLELVIGLPSLDDFTSFRELGLVEEAEEHRLRVAEALEGLVGRERVTVAVAVLDADGGILGAAGPPDERGALLAALADPDLEVAAACDGHPVALPHGGRVLLMWRPRFDQWGIYQGGAGMLLDPRPILREPEPSEGGVWVLLDPGGRPVSLGPGTGPGAESLQVSDRVGFLRHAASESTVVREGDGIEYVLFPSFGGQGWGVVRFVPEQAVFGSVRRIKDQTIAQIALGLLAGAALAYWLASWVAARLRPLADAARALGGGAVGIQVPVDSADEVGELARSFNQMSANLQATQEALERRLVEVQTAQAHLIQAERLSVLGTLASGIAHEIHSPLMTIGAQAGTIRLHAGRGQLDAAKIERLGDAIAREVEVAVRIIRSVQDYSRSSQPAADAIEDLPVGELVERAIAVVGPRAGPRVIRVEEVVDVRVLGERVRVVQVLVNLLQNALDATEDLPGRVVTVRVREVDSREDHGTDPPPRTNPFHGAAQVVEVGSSPRWVEIQVEDPGPGIDPENLPRLFDPFFTTKPSGKGTGLGLSICQGILWQFGGDIQIESAPGAGTRVRVFLPVSERGGA